MKFGRVLHRLKRFPRVVVFAVACLALQFGSNYAQVRQFKAAFLTELRKVVTVYGQVQVEATDNGLMVKPSLTHIPQKSEQ